MKKLGINEIFLPINGFENYEVSNYGNVRNAKTSKVLKTGRSNGYCFVNLCHIVDGRNKSISNKKSPQISSSHI